MFDAPPSQEAARPDHHTSEEATQSSSLAQPGAAAAGFAAAAERLPRDHPAYRAAYNEEAIQSMKAAEAEKQAKFDRLMAQFEQELAARDAAIWRFRLPPPFSPEVAAALHQWEQVRARAAAEEQRQKVEQQNQARAAAAEERRKARAAAKEQRQKAEARRAALLEPISLERKRQ
ncbi:hypothetical protein D9Q98_000103 [Chlorella vulgaris]|uniref:Uncharacterized protein n=1 Tax=Chlorella vulgaris TaxID=3077 RepID=A0A9D4TXL3_CHLVU|nr:hypothetical protein D9Q98_000103 [Chlorella vulgaris]